MHRLLLVDDSRSVLMTLKSQIDGERFYVQTALSVAEAWVLLERESFDCIISDFEMPEVNGPEFCRRIKSDERIASTPVMMLTSLTNTEHLLTAIDAGADDFISKDSDMRIILAKIHAMVRIKNTQTELTKLLRVEGIRQIIATYNHEFNNPLTIAIGNLNCLKKKCSDPAQMTHIDRLQDALGRMSNLVKKIREIRDYVETSYAGGDKMIAVSPTDTKRAG